MRAFTLIVCLLFLGCSHICNGGWTPKNSAMTVLYATAVAVDYSQTRYIKNHYPEYTEFNPIYGKDASRVWIMPLFIPFQWGVACALPEGTWRDNWQGFSAGARIVNDVINKSKGIGMER